MCGRFALINADKKNIKKRFSLKKVPKDLKPHYNISPSQKISVILNDNPDELKMVKWGLIPHWAKEENTKYSMINARAETITEKPAYRGPIQKHRCLILADTFYEWQQDPEQKKPYRFMMKDESIFAFAGIWDVWEKGNEKIETCSIVTTAANNFMKPFHERMPVILPQEFENKWLANIDISEVKDILKTNDDKLMVAYEISRMINSPFNDLPEVLNPV